ncbi:hypothetical protein [Nocardia huaxiensis]|uniref:hypothetical protein n=1 Tax=Nocardia huaxiensis TaxID=2755382 RepID=UPI001E4279AF|nr:hypothetical protein [Nocardia huaxiensis]UFS94817.1 hypothetical protein LPY97_29435 [Nocardia huaxiensis]
MHSLRRIKTVASYILAIVLGIGMIFGGFVSLNDSKSGKVTCGSREMHPGDTCQTTRKGKTTTRTYEEQKESDSNLHWFLFGIGTIMAIGGGVLLAREAGLFKRNGSSGNGPAGGGPSGGNGPSGYHPPMPQYPQPGQPAAPYGQQPNYGAPQGNPGQPPYGAPQGQPQYGAPVPAYGAPAPAYGGPPGYAPQPQPGYPQPQYGGQPGYAQPQGYPPPNRPY